MNEKFLIELKALLPTDCAINNSTISDDALGILLRRAENTILDFLGRDELPERLQDSVPYLALVMYNRMGAEGEKKHREGDVEADFTDGLPDDIKARLKNYPRKVGAVNGASAKQT